MGDLADDFREWRDHKRAQRQKHGAECEGCIRSDPRRNPSILFRGQQCRWCGWTRPEKDEPAATVPGKHFACSLCKKRFGTEIGRRDHMRDAHRAAPSPKQEK